MGFQKSNVLPIVTNQQYLMGVFGECSKDRTGGGLYGELAQREVQVGSGRKVRQENSSTTTCLLLHFLYPTIHYYNSEAL